MTVDEFLSTLDGVVPLAAAGSWDPVGLQIGSSSAEVGRVGVCHEVSSALVAKAVAAEIDTLVSYHPLLFAPTTTVVEDAPVEAAVMDLIRARMNLVVVHTAFDAARPGTGDALLAALGLPPAEASFGPVDDDDGAEIGRVSQLASPTTADELADTARTVLGVETRVAGDPNQVVERVGVVPGSGGSFIADTVGSLDCVITGDVRHHEARYAVSRGMSVIDIGHVPSERPGVEALYALVSDMTGDTLLVVDDPHPWRK